MTFVCHAIQSHFCRKDADKQAGHVDITHTVRIKCAMKQCEEVDLCPSCFCEGKEGLQHKAWHDYMVVVCPYLDTARKTASNNNRNKTRNQYSLQIGEPTKSYC